MVNKFHSILLDHKIQSTVFGYVLTNSYEWQNSILFQFENIDENHHKILIWKSRDNTSGGLNGYGWFYWSNTKIPNNDELKINKN